MLAVGKFMVNFGCVELLSHLWVDHMAQDEALVDVALEMPFGKRVDLVLQLLDREVTIPAEQTRQALATWQAAKELAEVRNAVAHNPAVFGWHGLKEGEPDFVGIPVLRKLARQPEGQVPYVGVDGLNKAVDIIVKVAQTLEQQLDELKRVLHSSVDEESSQDPVTDQ